MATLDYNYTFTNNTVANALHVTDNFATVKSFVENELVQTDGSVKLTLNALADEIIRALVPIGSITAFAGATAPAGWLLCDGTTTTTSYPILFSMVGGVTPDLRGRVPVGAGTGTGLTARTRGDVGGAETHTLTDAQIPSHLHTVNIVSTNDMSQHDHGLILSSTPSGSLTTVAPSEGAAIVATGSNTTSATTGPNNQPHQHTVFGNTGLVGGSGAHNNMQPFRVVNYIIKHD